MSNYPAGAENDPRAPWNQPDVDLITYKVLIQELEINAEPVGTQVMLLELINGEFNDELELYYDFEEDVHEGVLNDVDWPEYDLYTDAFKRFKEEVEYLKESA